MDIRALERQDLETFIDGLQAQIKQKDRKISRLDKKIENLEEEKAKLRELLQRLDKVRDAVNDASEYWY